VAWELLPAHGEILACGVPSFLADVQIRPELRVVVKAGRSNW
jgi:hypothetical protein